MYFIRSYNSTQGGFACGVRPTRSHQRRFPFGEIP